MAETTDKNNRSNETGDFVDISNRDSVQPVIASASIAPDSGEGTITGNTTSNEINKESSHVEPNLTEMNNRTDNANNSEGTVMSSELLSDSNDLELLWDEDDESNTLDSDTHKIDNDLERKLLKETEHNNQEVSNEIEKETESNLEDKLIQECINSTETSENQEQNQTDVEMELNEGELLLEGQSEDTEAMDVDDDIDSAIEKESVKNILDDSKLTEGVHAVTDIRMIQSPRTNDDHQDNDLSIQVDVSTKHTVKVTSGFSQPDVMIEIPTHEIDINDLLDSLDDEENDENMEETRNTSEEVTGNNTDIATRVVIRS